MIGILPKLTREYILEHTTEQDIIAHYMGISTTVIETCLYNNMLIKSPLRVDNSATCGFYVDRNSGRIRFNDFAGYFHGDCFDIVGYASFIDASTSQGFAKILDIIAKDFGLHKYGNKSGAEIAFTKSEKIVVKERSTVFHVVQRDWHFVDENYWIKKYKTDRTYLNHFDIVLVYQLYINSVLIYTFDISDPCYGHFIYTNQYGVDEWKFYFPYRNKKQKKPKFLSNTRSLLCINQIQRSRIGIITKSWKDVTILKTIGINSVAVVSESTIPTEREMKVIFEHYDNVYTLFDFDYSGIRLANKMRKLYNVQPLFFTNGRFNTINFHAKDSADFKERYGFDKFVSLAKFLAINGIVLTDNHLKYFEDAKYDTSQYKKRH